MSHWPELLLVAKARRAEPAAGPLGNSPLHAVRAAAISSTDGAVLTPPPEGVWPQIALTGACPKEGDASCGRASWGALLGKHQLQEERHQIAFCSLRLTPPAQLHHPRSMEALARHGLRQRGLRAVGRLC